VAGVGRRVEILLVDDNFPDAQLFAECLKEAPFPYQLSFVPDGEAALTFLQRQVPYTEVPRPDLILLDIRLVRQSGWEVLAWIRTQPTLRDIPVVMISSGFAAFDEEQHARLRPTRCVVKPRDLEDCPRVGKVIEEVIGQYPPGE
jgi:CheY-like chemotaxis protein